jgi:hypothetical protein
MQAETDKTHILDQTRAEYAFIERTLAALTPEEMVIPDVQGPWSVKDTLAHLTAWMKRLIGWLEGAQEGTPIHIPQEGYTWDDIDTFNDLQYEADKDRALDDVLADFYATYARAHALIDSLSEYDLFENTFNGAFYDGPWKLVVYNLHHHFHEHIIPVRAWMAERQQ